jgi:hypothetical protein
MSRTTEIRKIAFIGDYLPRKCGIATFTHDVCTSVATQFAGSDCFVVPVNDLPQGYDYPREVRFEIEEQELDSYLRAADYLNFANADIVCLQHEYGIFGGPFGSHIIRLLRNLRMPVATTLHTVLQDPTPGQKDTLQQLCGLSDRLVVRSQRNGDRRTSFISLTGKGRSMFEAMARAHQGWIDELLEDVTIKDATELSVKLKSFRSNWEGEA